jgi:hypothetical protein
MSRWLTIAEWLNPVERARREQEAEKNALRVAEMNLKADIAGAQLSQSAQHHYDNLELGRSRLDLDAQMESRRLSQSDRQHADKLALETRKHDLTETRGAADIALGRDRLSFDKESSRLAAQTSRDTALIGAISSQETALIGADSAQKTATIGADASRDVARIGQEGALALAQQNHSNALDLAREQAHLDIIGKAHGAAYDSISSSLRRGEDTNRAVSDAYAAIMTEKIRGRVARKNEDQKERHRANERQHERRMEILKAMLSRKGFEHTKMVELFAAHMAKTMGLGEMDEATLWRKFDEWAAHEGEKE